MAHVPKRVCIAGAGPSGLVAAKTLLHYQLPQSSCSSAIAAGVPRSQTEGPFFTVTLYDTQPRIGGLWPSSRSDRNGLVHPDMVANQSRHTVQFSDLAWPGSGAFDDKPGPEFPAAWQVGRYLQGYRERYLDGQPAGGNDVALGRAHGAEFRLGWKVEKTTLLDNGRWVVTARKVVDGVGQPETETREFDYVIVSTGFFGRPAFPQSLPEEAAKKAAVPVIHSSAYRDLSSLGLEEGGPLPKGLSILVVGGQMSGVEIAATIASHLSAAANAPEPSKIPAIEKITVHHVIQRPTWVFPLFLRASPDLPSFMDCDLSSYDLNKRPKPLTNSQGHISIPQARLFNVIYQGIVGTDQSDVSAHLSMAKHMDDPPYLVMSDFYSSFVRSGLIRISKGYLSHFSGTAATITPSIAGIGEMGNEDAVDLGLAAEQGKINLDIAAVVLATGFTATPSLSFLPDSVLSTLSHSPQHSLTIPLILDFHNTLHAALPTLGFVGFYRSPYWGVMEQQARLLATLWAHDSRELARPASLTRALQQDDSAARMRALRTDERCSQFPMGDYSFLMNAFAEALDMSISPLFPPTSDSVAGVSGFDPKGPPQTDVLTPSRYTFPNATVDERRQTERSLCYTRQTLEAALTTPRFVARAVFRGLHGPWNIERRIDSRMRHLQPPGSFRGTGEFLLRGGSRDGREAATDRLLDRQRQEQQACGGDGQDGPEPVGWGTVTEYLYDEKGSFESDDGRLCFPATQRYVWRLDEDSDSLAVWFAGPPAERERRRADYLFHELRFDDKAEMLGGGKCLWGATAGHLCIADFYDVRYEFVFSGATLERWSLAYNVKGPQKDYDIRSDFRRHSPEM